MTEYKKGPDVNIIKESALRYGIERYRGYTIEDYYSLPENTRAELIDGVLYDMASPTVRHQDIAMQVSFQMVAYVNKKGGKCKVLQGPVDVQLDCDDKTMVVPDIIIVSVTSIHIRYDILSQPDVFRRKWSRKWCRN